MGGPDDDEAALLAELLAISSRSAASSRFVNPDDPEDSKPSPPPTTTTTEAPHTEQRQEEQEIQSSSSFQNGTNENSNDRTTDNNTAAETVTTKSGMTGLTETSKSMNRQGEAGGGGGGRGGRGGRGGSVGDELPPWKRGKVKAPPPSTTTTQDGGNEDNQDGAPSGGTRSRRSNMAPPPWKRQQPQKSQPRRGKGMNAGAAGASAAGDVVVVSSSSSPAADAIATNVAEDDAPTTGDADMGDRTRDGQKQGKTNRRETQTLAGRRAAPGFQKQPASTFQGTRGGAAEDAELLAELLAISNQSKTNSRFDDRDDHEGGTSNDDYHNSDPNTSETTTTTTTTTTTVGKDNHIPTDVTKPLSSPSNRASHDTSPHGDDNGNDNDNDNGNDNGNNDANDNDNQIQLPPPPLPPWKQPKRRGKPTQNNKNGNNGNSQSNNELAVDVVVNSESRGPTGKEEKEEEEVSQTMTKENKNKNEKSLPPWKRRRGKPTNPPSSTTSQGADVVLMGASSSSSKADGMPSENQVESENTNIDHAVPTPDSTGTSTTGTGTGTGTETETGTGTGTGTSFQKPSNKNMPFTFQGDRGGTAEDAELLAELMAISNRSKTNSRFVDADSNDIKNDPVQAEIAGPPPPSESSPAQLANTENTANTATTSADTSKKKMPGKSESSLPPWKRGGRGRKVEAKTTPDVEVVASSPKPLQTQESAEAIEVLAISDKTAPPEPAPAPGGGGGFKKSNNMPFTFQGDRGGSAEDADLLAELMAISNKSKTNSRFENDNDDNTDEAGNDSTETLPPPPPPQPSQPSQGVKPATKPSSSGRRNNQGAELPPWKRKGPAKAPQQESSNEAPPSTSAATTESTKQASPLPPSNEPPVVGGFQKEKNPFTFQGDRGGAAEDAELLAALMAISSKSASSGRFASPDDDNNDTEHKDVAQPMPQPPPPTQPPKPKSKPPSRRPPPLSPPAQSTPPAPPTPSSQQGDDPEIVVTKETLPESIVDKNWKVRKTAYAFLTQLLREATANLSEGDCIESDVIMEGLDARIPTMVADKNAGALDAALEFGVLYADKCTGATSAEHVSAIVASMFKGGAFSASRPSTVKHCATLTTKLMEVGSDGSQSAHAAVNVLLEKGLASRKPKEVVAVTGVILEAALDFGAGALPLAGVKAKTTKMLSHSNGTVRENGMKILAEFCRALGSKAPLQDVLDDLKKAQLAQLDELIQLQPHANPPRIGLRSSRQSASSGASPPDPQDALAALEAQSKEMEAQRFASRPAANILQALPKTDYAARIKLAKWSEKVAALDMVLAAGGEQPYKLVDPSATVNYAPLISEMKKLTAHTHFAVSGKAMQVLAMLAEGVGDKLYAHLRPLLGLLLGLSKDKKLNKAAASCLDSFFGNILSLDHILDEDDAIPTTVDERKQKNALARSSALDFLGRCIQRGPSAGPRGKLNLSSIKKAVSLCVEKLDDSDASVRKAATEMLKVVLASEKPEIASVADTAVDGLKTSHPRVLKTLKGSARAKPPAAAAENKAPPSQSNASSAPPASGKRGGASTGASTAKSNAGTSGRATEAAAPNSRKHQKATSSKAGGMATTTTATDSPGSFDGEPMTKEDSIETLRALDVPLWGVEEDYGSILDALQSPKWQSRKIAIVSLVKYAESNIDSVPTVAFLSCVKHHTKSFKESNFNIIKAIMELFAALSTVHASRDEAFPGWAIADGVALAVDKIADKKLASSASVLLLELCVIAHPGKLANYALTKLESVKSPLSHEAMMNWLKEVCVDFGAAVLASTLNEIVKKLAVECDSSNLKVRNAALSLMGELHTQLGPAFGALALSSCEASAKANIEGIFEKNPFDPNAKQAGRKRSSMALRSKGSSGGNAAEAEDLESALEVPKTDLAIELGKECIVKLGSKDGKTAWKARKAAMDEVEAAVKDCSGLLATGPAQLKFLVDLLRALRDRLTDSQSNLKPIAARCICSILSKVDKPSQPKLGSVVFEPLFGAAINDNRIPMREASLLALRQGITSSSIEGGGTNDSTLETLMNAFVAQCNESGSKAVGLPEALDLIETVATNLPNLDQVLTSRGQSLGDKFAQALIDCLTSAKSETRNSAEKLLKSCLEAGAISAGTVRKSPERLKPAQQRTVAPIILRLVGSSDRTSGKENVPAPSKAPNDTLVRGSSRRSLAPQGRSSTPPKSRRSKSLSGNLMSRHELPTTEEDEPEDDSHPLLSSNPKSSSSKQKRLSSKQGWCEFPEEPTSSIFMATLRKEWVPMLPSSSAKALFPQGGIRKQEDAINGCDVLKRALQADRKGDDAVAEQLDLVLKWLLISMCSREHTVGLQKILSFQVELFTFLGERAYILQEVEALLFLPWLFERASNAKGRFKESFNDVLSAMNDSSIVSSKILGPVIYVLMIERSSNAKARVFAFQQCIACVEEIGLAGLGKKGLLLTTKALSEESLPENRTAALDLIEVVLTKMNGDIERLARICGPSNLSLKARTLIEERWSKRSAKPTGGSSRSLVAAKSPRVSLLPPRAGQARMSRRSLLMPPGGHEAENGGNDDSEHRGGTSDIFMPKFELRLGGDRPTSPPQRADDEPQPTGPFTFSLEDSYANVALHHTEEGTEMIPGESVVQPSPTRVQSVRKQEERKEPPAAILRTDSTDATDTAGTAASLRARLMKIRERHRALETTDSIKEETENESERDPPMEAARVAASHGMARQDEAAPVMAEHVDDGNQLSPQPPVPEENREICFDDAMHFLECIRRKPAPVAESDPDMQRSVNALKKCHAALANGPQPEDPSLASLRQQIVEKSSTTVLNIAPLLGFSFECGDKRKDAGIAVSLLSVALATLMALFRDESLAHAVSQEALLLLIRETGKALLDTRLAVSTQMASSLDESTSSQMVRAINKLAVQGATGSRRDVSILALLSLQQHLTLQETDTPTGTAFNGRLSRIVMKLFAKVLKAEEELEEAFISVDLEALLSASDDMLVAIDEDLRSSHASSRATCNSMAKSLVEALVKTHGVRQLQQVLQDVGIDPRHSEIAKLIVQVAPTHVEHGSAEAAESDQGLSSSPGRVSINVATLVSKVASSQTEEERKTAIANLKRYRKIHGDSEINEHLSQVSTAFRAFVLEQLKPDGGDAANSHVPESGANSTIEDNNAELSGGRNVAMSERLRSLRFRLDSNEPFGAQSSVEKAIRSAPTSPSRDTQEAPKSTSRRNSPQRLGEVQEPEVLIRKLSSRLSRPVTNVAMRDTTTNEGSAITEERPSSPPSTSPSRFRHLPSSGSTSPTHGTIVASSSVLSLRQRLAAAQQSRKNHLTSGIPSAGTVTSSIRPKDGITPADNRNTAASSSSSSIPSTTATSSTIPKGRGNAAAALRARLEAVRKQNAM